jgi:Ca2+-dependent lipid-binding protein
LKATLNPDWNEIFVDFPVKNRNDELIVKVMDKNTVTRDDFLGSAKIALNTLKKDEEKLMTLKLEEVASGEITIAVTVKRGSKKPTKNFEAFEYLKDE